MKSPRATLALVIASCLLSTTDARAQSLELLDGPALRGASHTIRLRAEDGSPVPDARLRVIHSPNAHVERAVELGATDAAGQLRWVPAQGGLAVLEALDESGASLVRDEVAVRYERLPLSALGVFLFSCVFLFCGLFLFLCRALRAPSAP